jgi:predicted phage tail protein
MQLVMLAGELGEKYGTHHEYYNLRTPADAIKLLCVNFPQLQRDLMIAHHNGVGYKLIQAGAAMGYDELHLPFGSKPMVLVPVIAGSGGASTTQILIGVGLVAASFLFPGAGLFGTVGLSGGILGGGAAVAGVSSGAVLAAASIGTAISAVGASMILGGVANMISPQPEMPRLSQRRMETTNFNGPGAQGITRGSSGEQSYAYRGATNTVGAGVTIPVVYGRALVGGHLLSVNVVATDDSDPLATAIKEPGQQTVLINGERPKRRFQEEVGLETKKLTRAQAKKYKADRDEKVRVPSANEGFGPGLSKNLAENEVLTFDGIEAKNATEDAGRGFDVIFHVDRGCFSRAGEALDTQKIDGTFRFEIEVIHARDGGVADQTVVQAATTFQGYLETTQNYFFAQRMRFSRQQNNKDVTLKIAILDEELQSGTKFRVLAYGYNLV